MDFYEILDVPLDASTTIIKKQYRKLAVRWHPDKNPINKKQEAEEKFKQISMAYQILSNPEKRKEYNKLNIGKKQELFDIIKSISKSLINEKMVKFFYEREEDFYTDVNKMNLDKVISKMRNKIMKSSIEDIFSHFLNQAAINKKVNNFQNVNSFIDQDSETLEDQDTDTDIIEYEEYDILPTNYNVNNNSNIKITVQATIQELINKNYKKINIKRKVLKYNEINYETKVCIFPILKNYVIFKNYGDQTKNNNCGDLIIKIERVEDKDYYIIDNHHLLLIKDISLYQYIYGFNFKLKNFGSTIDMGELILLNNKLRFQIKNQGLPYDYDSEIRGELIIQFNIKIENTDEKQKILLQNFNN